MTELIERIGNPMFVQIVIEIWNEIIFILLISTMIAGIRRDKEDTQLRKIEIPMTKELIIFFTTVFIYDLCDIVDIIVGGTTGPFAYVAIRTGVFCYYAVGGLQMLFFLKVVDDHVVKNDKCKTHKALRAFQILQLADLVLLAVTPFTNALYTITARNEYKRSWGYWVWQGVGVVTILFIVLVIIIEWEHTSDLVKKMIMVAALFPMIALVFSVVVHKISLNNIMIAISALLMFMVYEKNKSVVAMNYARELEKTQRNLAENKLALEKNKNEMLMAQIQPHFINNSLMALRSQCVDYPEIYESLTDFSRYLRSNFEALGDTRLILFEQEMENIEAYLSLEERNFGDRLNVEYEIGYDDFLIPILSVQPLVENAVRHGVASYEKGGTVRIVTRKEDDSMIIEVIDKGIGRSGLTKQQEHRKGIGIENVRTRLRTMTSGELEIIPTENGTTARITIKSIEK
ncbi:MAG: histidine kinase [Oscillospiraceae bacterium]|nr:histidine kinase [Oscillospiraceae bacterium]